MFVSSFMPHPILFFENNMFLKATYRPFTGILSILLFANRKTELFRIRIYCLICVLFLWMLFWSPNDRYSYVKQRSQGLVVCPYLLNRPTRGFVGPYINHAHLTYILNNWIIYVQMGASREQVPPILPYLDNRSRP